MRRLIWSTLLGVLTLLVIATPALAGKIWCARDPMVSLNGNDVQIWVATPAEYQSYVTGPIDFDILTPKRVSQPDPLTAPSTTLRSKAHRPRPLLIVPEMTVAL